MAENLPKILIVDDAGLVRLYYRQALEIAGYIVEEALNGVEALEKLLPDVFDLLIVDINMPKMDGFTFVRTLRARGEPFSTIPALMTSTEAAEHDIEAARVAGANYYLRKPVSEADLLLFTGLLTGRVS